MPDSKEPDTVILLPDLVVTKGGARFTLPGHRLRNGELRQQFTPDGGYSLGLLETSNSQRLEFESIILTLLSRAWEYASELDPSEATEFASS